MRKTLILFGVLLLLAGLSSATTCTFDTFSGVGQVPDGYCGINWNNQWTYYDTPQPPYTPHSGLERVFPTNDSPSGTFNFLSPAVFNGAWFAGYTGLSGDLTYTMLLGGNVVATASMSSNNLSDVPVFFASGYNGLVDEVIVSSAADFWIMDDVTYNQSNGNVPEPASLALFITGAAGALGAVRRRLKK